MAEMIIDSVKPTAVGGREITGRIIYQDPSLGDLQYTISDEQNDILSLPEGMIRVSNVFELDNYKQGQEGVTISITEWIAKQKGIEVE